MKNSDLGKLSKKHQYAVVQPLLINGHAPIELTVH